MIACKHVIGFPLDRFSQFLKRALEAVDFIKERSLGVADGLVFIIHAFEADVCGGHEFSNPSE